MLGKARRDERNPVTSFALEDNLRALYEPQLEQLGMPVVQDRLGLIVQGARDWGYGYLRTLPITKNAALFFLDLNVRSPQTISPKSVPYACAALMSHQSVRNFPLPFKEVEQGQDAIAAFAYAEESKPFVIEGGTTYRSASFCYLPSFFDDMNERFKDGFDTLFAELSRTPADEVPGELATIMASLAVERTFRPGALPYFQSKGFLVAAILNDYVKGKAEADNGLGCDRQARMVGHAQSIIERDLARPPSVSALAEQLYVSRSYLCAAFKRETGTTISEWVRKARIERATAMMENPANSLSHIARSVGFEHLSSFSKAFRRETGACPTEWRRNR